MIAGWPARIAVLALLAGLAVFLGRRASLRVLLASPLALLAAAATIAYSILPALSPVSTAGYLVHFPPYPGSRGEMLVLAFAAGCAVLLAALAVLDRPPPAPHVAVTSPATLPAFLLLALWAGGTPLLHFLPERAAGELRHILPALFCAAAAQAALGKKRGWPGMAPALAATLVLPVLTMGKIPVMILAAVVWTRAILAPPRLRVALPATILLALLATAGLGTLEYWRGNTNLDMLGDTRPSLLAYAPSIPANAAVKLSYRQLESGTCLNNAMEARWDQPGRNSPFYFAAALVPRALWPGKPSLSNGHDYGARYCTAGNFPTMSNSVTLLGEPIIEAGRAGLAAAMAVLAALLTGLTLLARRHPLGPAILAGLAPWLIDFDQHFAMYLANLAKTALIQAPLWLLLGTRTKDVS